VTLYQPVWLILAVPLAASLWLWRFPSRLLLALRVLTLLLVLLALCGLAVLLPGRAGTVVVVADRSRSMPADADTAEKDVADLLADAMSPDDRLGVVAFGRSAAVERAPQPGRFGGFVHEVGGDASNLAEALETALALIPRDAPGRVLVVSDGRWTGRDPAGAAARAAARGVAIDYRPLQRAAAGDLAIARFDAPSSVAPGEAFLLTGWVRSPVQQNIAFELRRGNEVLAAGKRRVPSGLSRLTFRDRAAEPGTQAYVLHVTGSGADPVPENNRARLLVGVSGPRPVLLVTAAPAKSGLARLLRAGKLVVRAAPPQACTWSLEELSKYSAVVLENVPAERVGPAGLETLAAWVRSTGGGLMLTGGRSSFGPGGYYHSPLDPLLPVSMELRNEHRKLKLAIVVALDRSGSMAMPVAGGRVKMDLANLGTVAVLDLLGPQDEFGCLAVDTVPHVIHELGEVKDRAGVRDRILRIQSMGGGIYVYEALEAAHAMLQKAQAQTKHIILFADAADAEEPKAYKELVAQCREDGMTVSVIGLGKETDKDGELLKDIARRGNGRCFFSDQPDDLPRLFAQETFVVARSTFLDDPTPVRATAGLTALAGRPFDLMQPVGGYNLCYLRPGANLAAVTLDEYKAPLVAAWQAGSGRVLCYTGEADGRYTGAIAGWKAVGEFFTSLARWTGGPTGELPGNMLVTQDVRNGVAVVRLHLDPRRQAEPFTDLPGVAVLRATAGQRPWSVKAALHWEDADTLAADVTLDGDETVLAAVDVPGRGAVVLPPACLPYSPEYRPAEAGTGLAALERLARSTGGNERVELASVWQDFPRRPRLVEVGHWLLVAAVLVLLLEILERRTGVLALALTRAVPRRQARAVPASAEARPLPRLTGRVARGPLAAPAAAPPAADADPVAAADERTPEPVPAAEPRDKGGLLDALRQARQRTRGGGSPPA
jgi:Mg-chelatase subunit ChlD